MNRKQTLSFFQIILPVLFQGVLILYGMVIRPKFLGQTGFPLEIVFMLAAVFAIGELMIIGFKWKDIQHAFIQKLSRGFPALLILFAIV